MNQVVQQYNQKRIKNTTYDFRPGDTVRVSVRIVEGEKERIQDFEGVCIRRHGSGMDETFTVRRVSYGVGMERIFTINAPRVEDIRVIRRGKVRRANLEYLRRAKGKQARVTEDILRTRKMAANQAAAKAAVQEEEAAAVEAEAQEAPAAEAPATETPEGPKAE